MTPEELLKPRYKVIGSWPYSGMTIDTILNVHSYNLANEPIFHIANDRFLNADGMNTYPHLFRKLEWWQQRKPEDMPEYIRVRKTEEVKRVKEFVGMNHYAIYTDGLEGNMEYCLPSTANEYKDYINQNK